MTTFLEFLSLTKWEVIVYGYHIPISVQTSETLITALTQNWCTSFQPGDFLCTTRVVKISAHEAQNYSEKGLKEPKNGFPGCFLRARLADNPIKNQLAFLGSNISSAVKNLLCKGETRKLEPIFCHAQRLAFFGHCQAKSPPGCLESWPALESWPCSPTVGCWRSAGNGQWMSEKPGAPSGTLEAPPLAADCAAMKEQPLKTQWVLCMYIQTPHTTFCWTRISFRANRIYKIKYHPPIYTDSPRLHRPLEKKYIYCIRCTQR